MRTTLFLVLALFLSSCFLSAQESGSLIMLRCDKAQNTFLDSPTEMNLGTLQKSFDPQADTIIMVHGFHHTFESAQSTYQEVQKILQPQLGNLNFVGFSWPCDLLLDFGKGMKYANTASRYLTHVISQVNSWYGKNGGKIHIMSSSLGNRVTLGALKSNESRYVNWGHCFNFAPGVHQDVYFNEFNKTNLLPQENTVFYASNDFVLKYLYALYYWAMGRDDLSQLNGYQEWNQLAPAEKIEYMQNLDSRREVSSAPLNQFSQFDTELLAQIDRAKKNAMGLVGADLGSPVVVENVENINVTKLVKRHSYWKNPKVLETVVKKLK